MLFVCAVTVIASASAALCFGGATCFAVSAQTLVLLPLLARSGLNAGIKKLLVPLWILSPIMRFTAVATVSKSALGEWGALTAVLLCIAVVGFAVNNRTCVRLAATPLFFVSAILAVYVGAVSFTGDMRSSFPLPDASELLSAAVCPLSICSAVIMLGKCNAAGCIKGAALGVLVTAPFILFESAGAEFGFICVPLAVAASAIELKAATDVIIAARRE